MYHMVIQSLLMSIPMTIAAIVNFIIQLMHKRITGSDSPSTVGDPVKNEHKHGSSGSSNG